MYQKSWSYAILLLRYGVWGMYLLFFILGYFLHFYPLNSPKNENFKTIKKKKKTLGDIIILHKCTKNHDHMLYCSWDMVRDRCNFFILSYFFPFYLLNSLKNQKLKRKMEKRLVISPFYTCVRKMMIRWCMVPETWCPI